VHHALRQRAGKRSEDFEFDADKVERRLDLMQADQASIVGR
jgi:hypothetical protein